RVGHDRIDRGQARHAAPAPAVRGPERPVRAADARTQHGNHALGACGAGKGQRLVFLAREPRTQGPALVLGQRPGQPAGDEYCGGMQAGHELYGYFPGGASGGILPASMADIPLDFDTLQEIDASTFIGSAAIIVFSQQDKARDLAEIAMRFFAHESCGQCTPCRVGTDKAATLMQERQWDGELLEDLAKVMVDASICGLGQAAPNPLRWVIKYFPDEVA